MITKFMIAVVSMLAVASAFAGQTCIKEKNPCDPNLLCTFKAEWQSKVHAYTIYAANDVSRRGKKKTVDGIKWEGTLYTESMNEATAIDPSSTPSEIKQRAAQIFQEKIRKVAADTFVMPECEIGGKYDYTRAAKPGYRGMNTLAKDCTVWVDYYAAPYDPRTFGQTDKVCEEFYTRDFAHEQIHANICKKVLGKPRKEARRNEIQNSIKEEMKSYKHSIKLTEAYYKILLSQCSPKFPNNENVRKQLNEVAKLLKGYEARNP